MAIKVRPRIIPPIDRSWKNTSLEWEDPTAGERSAVRTKVTKQSKTKSWKDSPLEYADPTAAKRTKKAIKKRVPKHSIRDFLPGGMVRAVRKKIAPKLLPKDKRKTAKNPLAVDIQGKGSKPTSKVREQQKAEKMKADTAAYRKKYLAKSKAKEKPIQKFETIEAEGGGKVQYRSIGGKVVDGNDITGMIYD